MKLSMVFHSIFPPAINGYVREVISWRQETRIINIVTGSNRSDI